MGVKAEDEGVRFDRAVQSTICDKGTLANQRSRLRRNLFTRGSLPDGSSCEAWAEDPSGRRSNGVSSKRRAARRFRSFQADVASKYRAKQEARQGTEGHRSAAIEYGVKVLIVALHVDDLLVFGQR